MSALQKPGESWDSISSSIPARRKMNFQINRYKLVLTVLFVCVLFSLNACSDRDTLTEKSFVGKWKSTRAAMPIYLYDNGEWEIKSDDGAVLQYGVWQLKGQNILWSYKIDSSVGHDLNLVLSVTPREFKVRESDRSTTTFSRLE